MVKVVDSKYIPKGGRHIGQMCFSRGEALKAAQWFDKIGREPVIERPLKGSRIWMVWVKN